MIQDIFLTYANNSLKGKPENLHQTLFAIEQNLEIDLEGVSEVIDIICTLSKYTDPEPILSIIEADSDFRPLFGSGTKASHARYAVAGGRDVYYAQVERFRDDPDILKELNRSQFDCELRAITKEMLGEDLCEESFVLKCYECHQLKEKNTQRLKVSTGYCSIPRQSAQRGRNLLLSQNRNQIHISKRHYTVTIFSLWA